MNLTPYVIEQTPRGERSFDIYSRLLEDRIILIFGEITPKTVATTSATMLIISDKFFICVLCLMLNNFTKIIKKYEL